MIDSSCKENMKSISTEILTKKTIVVSPSFPRGGPPLVHKVRDVLKPTSTETPRF